MDDEGWFYVVDRMKDLINAAGYKVWPREVEDVLYEHLRRPVLEPLAPS
jgi:long-chain acyl-CoA synthetase